MSNGSKYYWNGNGRSLLISDMDTNHIINTIPLLKRRIETLEDVSDCTTGHRFLLEEKELLLAMKAELRKRLIKMESEL